MLIEKLGVTHEDARRTIVEWHAGLEMRALKIVTAKASPTQIGRHYHRRKREVFYLLAGEGTINGFPIHAGTRVTVLPGEVHAFDLEAGSILLGAASEQFDPEDEVTAL